MKDYTEKTIICKDCGKSFILSIGEQKFYDGKGLSYPIRCKNCRGARKVLREPAKREYKEELVEKKSMSQSEIDAILAKWRENTVPFEKEETHKVDLYNRHNSTTNRRK